VAREPDDDLDPYVDPDDEAFHWAGDEARGQHGPALAGPVDEPIVATEGAPDAVAAPRSPARLVGTGVFAGVFLAYTVGWILSVQTLSSGTTDLLAEIMWQFGEFLAIIAAALWFASTTSLTRAVRTAVRFGWLALGVLLLFPWPIVWGLL
jgi:hypothetical protein